MEEKKKSNIKRTDIIWGLLFSSAPFFVIREVREYFGPDMMQQMIGSTILGALFAAIGFLVTKFTRKNKKRVLFRALGLTISVVASFGIVKAIPEDLLVDPRNKVTCPVCGYKTLIKEADTCPITNVSLTIENAKKEGFETVDEYLFAEQLVYFMNVDGSDAKFFEPLLYQKRYLKDPNWKPVVTQDTINKYYEQYIKQ